MNPTDNTELYKSAYQTLRTIFPTEDIFHTFLVAAEHRPACIATIALQNETGRPFCESPQRPQITKDEAEEIVADTLNSFNLTYEMESKELQTRQVTNIYITNSQQRLSEFSIQTTDELKIGAFLGYPTEAVKWYLEKDGRISDWKEWYLKFDATSYHDRQPHFVEHYNYVEYIPAPTKQSYREAFALADERANIAQTLNTVCDTTAFTDIKYGTRRKPAPYGVLYALFRYSFEQTLDRN